MNVKEFTSWFSARVLREALAEEVPFNFAPPPYVPSGGRRARPSSGCGRADWFRFNGAKQSNPPTAAKMKMANGVLMEAHTLAALRKTGLAIESNVPLEAHESISGKIDMVIELEDGKVGIEHKWTGDIAVAPRTKDIYQAWLYGTTLSAMYLVYRSHADLEVFRLQESMKKGVATLHLLRVVNSGKTVEKCSIARSDLMSLFVSQLDAVEGIDPGRVGEKYGFCSMCSYKSICLPAGVGQSNRMAETPDLW